MKKLLISLLIGVTVLGVGCGQEKVAQENNNVEVVETKVDEKREEFLEKAYEIIKEEVDSINKKYVEDKIELRREDNVIIYHIPYADGEVMSEWQAQDEEDKEFMTEYAKGSRQTTVTALNKYYDEIVETLGDDYEFFIKSEKSSGGEIFQIIKIGKDDYEIEYDLLAEMGY